MINPHRMPLAGQRSQSPPTRVLWFEALFYISSLVSAIWVALLWTGKGDDATAIALSVLIGVQLMLIWLTARHRKTWARNLLLGFFLIWSFSGILSAGLSSRAPNWQPDIPIQIMRLAKIFLETTALILIFTGSSRRWFNPRLKHRDPNSP